MVTISKRYYSVFHSSSLSPVLSLPLTSPPFSLSPRPQDLPFQVDSKAKGTPIGVENHHFHSFLLGVASFQLEKVPKLGLNGMIVLGCFK